MIASYDDLVKQIPVYTKRDDLTNIIPLFIQLAEIEMYNNEAEQLQVMEMEFTSTAPTSSRRLELPPFFEKARSVQIETSNGLVDVKYQGPEQLVRQPAQGMPRFFTVVGGEIVFDRTPDSEYTIQVQYYRKPTPISATNQTNAIITDYANIYLWGVMHQYALWAEENDEIVLYFSKFQNAIKGANRSNKNKRYGQNPSMSVNGAMRP